MSSNYQASTTSSGTTFSAQEVHSGDANNSRHHGDANEQQDQHYNQRNDHKSVANDNLTSINSTSYTNLLKLVAKGNVIIAELNRLIELVPTPFKQQASEDNGQQYLDSDKRFTIDDLICDFSYFKNTELFESRIEKSEVLRKADGNFCDTFVDAVTRFYLTFESIQKYAKEVNSFVSELEEDNFAGQNVDSLLSDATSRQLLCEAYFLLGYMLMTTDNNFEGGLRERLIVSYYRYSSYKSSPDSNLDETCNLMRSTGYRTPQQLSYRSSSVNSSQYIRPSGYPESFFSRVSVNQSVVNLMIAKLQTADIYEHTLTTFPHPDHRSTALNRQASMLYVILYFCPNILNSQRSRMREITDKFFYDNWIVSIYLGELVNLIEAWNPYKAARESLAQLLEVDSVKTLASQHNSSFCRLNERLRDYLKEGVLNEDLILEHYQRIVNHIREANVVLRWMLLQSQTHQSWRLGLTKTVHSIVMRNMPQHDSLFGFLQNLSELEKKFSIIFERMVVDENVKAAECKGKAVELLQELVDIFSDAKPMRYIKAGANMKLLDILADAKLSLEAQHFGQSNSRDFIINLISYINKAQDSYSDGKNMQVVQLFMETRENLLRAYRYLNLNDEMSLLLKHIGDFSYAWRLMDTSFTSHMQRIIKDDPHKLYGIEATFLKLTLAFEPCTARIKQSNLREDLVSVSQYYSIKLVTYIRDVLHIIPTTILELLSVIVSTQTEHVIGHMPAKVSLDSLKDFALPDKRIRMLELTYKASHYAESMLLMQNTTIGLIKINTKQLLEDGIRRELVRRMSDSIQEILQFPENGSSTTNVVKLAENLLEKLSKLDSVMNGYKRSLEYIQDYLFIYGLRMWQEELNHIVKFNIERASEALLSEGFLSQPKISSSEQTMIWSKAPVPEYGTNPIKSSFIARLLNELLKITDPRLTIYDEQMSAWYSQRNQHDKVIDLKVFELIASSLCVTGLNGVDELCCTLLKVEIQILDGFISTTAIGKSLRAQSLSEALKLLTDLREGSSSNVDISINQPQLESNDNRIRMFSTAVLKVAPFSEKIINNLLRIGQLQAIRTSISCVLSTKSRYEARNLYQCLATLNTSLLSTLKHGKQSIQQSSIINESGHMTNCEDEYNSSETEWDDDDDDEIDYEDVNDQEKPDIVTDIEEQQMEDLEDSQLIFELSKHLDWIGLSDPISKIYTLALQASNSSQVYEFREKLVAIDVIFLVLIDQCSKFQFSPLVSGFLPKQSRSFYETSYTVDGQPFFYGLITLLHHYKPFLQETSKATSSCSAPLIRLLEHMSLYVKCALEHSVASQNNKASSLTLDTSNMILSIVELVRLSRQSSGTMLLSTFLPEFIFDTFQFTMCHVNSKQTSS